MKILTLFLLFYLSSCAGKNKLSESDKQLIELKLSYHRDNAALEYKLARINKKSEIEIKYLNREDVSKLKELELRVWEGKWNEENDIMKDSTFSLDKYLDYCRAHGYDPVTKIDFLKTKP